jgi:hypothetical protein
LDNTAVNIDFLGADAEERNMEGLTAFHIALKHGHTSALKHFFDTYPPKEPEFKSIYKLNGSNTLLGLALESYEPEVVWMILDQGLANTQDIAKVWSRVAPSSEKAPTSNKSTKRRENMEEIRNLLMTFGGFTPPNTPKVSQDNLKSSSEQHRSGTNSSQPGTISPIPTEEKKSRQPSIQSPVETTSHHPDRQMPVNKGRGRGKARGKARGRSGAV